MRPTAPFLGVLTAVFLIGCSPGGDIDYRHLSDAELVAQSPAIFVGKVDSLKTFPQERVAHGSENGTTLFWFHREVRISIENVLRGDVMSPSLTYTYWIPNRGTTGEWNSFVEGARYVHFLRRSRAGWRALVDFWPSAIRVTTGHHGATSGADLTETIARLLLEPGDDFDPDRFHALRALSDAERLVGFQRAVDIAMKSDRIRLQVCQFLRQEPGTARSCLDSERGR